MLIIDKHKDFYDYLSHVYGVDNGIVFDRRGSEKISDEMLVELSLGNSRNNRTGFILMEVGSVQYIVKFYDIVYVSVDSVPKLESFKVLLEHTYRENRHIFKDGISIHGVYVPCRYNWKKKPYERTYYFPSFEEILRKVGEKSLDLPILARTSLTKILSPGSLWQNLQMYISSLGNDRDVDLNMSDKEKAGVHGFDKYSFRNPIK